MNTIIERYNKIKSFIDKNNYKANIVAISKTFDMPFIRPLIELGHVHFGENKVQEAEKKWNDVLKNNNNIKLHMVGKLQTNKAKIALEKLNSNQYLNVHIEEGEALEGLPSSLKELGYHINNKIKIRDGVFSLEISKKN